MNEIPPDRVNTFIKTNMELKEVYWDFLFYVEYYD